MTDAEERLLFGFSQGSLNVGSADLAGAIRSALHEVWRLRREAPPRVEVDRGDDTAPVGPMALLRVEPEETLPFWKGRAQALEDEVGRLVDLVRLLARD